MTTIREIPHDCERVETGPTRGRRGMSEQAKPVCYHCRLPIKNGLADWHQTRHAKPTYCVDALRAALDQERADNERLRACMDELRQGALHMPMTVDRIDVIECLHAHGMCETDGNPTALLSGRGDGGNDA